MGCSDPVLCWPWGYRKRVGLRGASDQSPPASSLPFFHKEGVKDSQEQTQEHLDGDETAEVLRWVGGGSSS